MDQRPVRKKWRIKGDQDVFSALTTELSQDMALGEGFEPPTSRSSYDNPNLTTRQNFTPTAHKIARLFSQAHELPDAAFPEAYAVSFTAFACSHHLQRESNPPWSGPRTGTPQPMEF